MSDQAARALSAEELAARTPASRDRFIDLLRVASIVVVMLGHWMMAVVTWDGELRAENLLALVPALQPLTWLLQVMPLFFIVGGFSNAVSLASVERRGGGYADFLHQRLARLLRPVLVLLMVWLPLAAALALAMPGGAGADALAMVAVQPLWFIALYVLVVAFTPLSLGWHRRYGLAAPVALALVVAAVDAGRFLLELHVLGWLNYAAVWLFAHQLGYLYADGSLARLSRPRLAALGGGALLALLLLTTFGPYPLSMVGLPGDPISNMAPPTLCIVALSCWLLALALALRAPLARLMERPRPWMLVALMGSAIMTIFLWHITALALLAGALYGLGVALPAPATAPWWLSRPLWIAALALVLALFVRVFARVEQATPAPSAPAGPGRLRGLCGAVGVAYVVVGLAGLSLCGLRRLAEGQQAQLLHLSLGPLLSLLYLCAGAAMVGLAVSPRLRRGAAALALGFGVLAALELGGLSGTLLGRTPDAVTHLLTAGLFLAFFAGAFNVQRSTFNVEGNG